MVQITPGRYPTRWNQQTRGGAAWRDVGGFTLHEAHLAAAVALAANDDVLEVTALVHVRCGVYEVPMVAALLKALCRTRNSISIPGMSRRRLVRMERVAWETGELGHTEPGSGATSQPVPARMGTQRAPRTTRTLIPPPPPGGGLPDHGLHGVPIGHGGPSSRQYPTGSMLPIWHGRRRGETLAYSWVQASPSNPQ